MNFDCFWLTSETSLFTIKWLYRLKHFGLAVFHVNMLDLNTAFRPQHTQRKDKIVRPEDKISFFFNQFSPIPFRFVRAVI